MKNLLLIAFFLMSLCVYSQNKKEQIAALNNKVDSLFDVIEKMNIIIKNSNNINEIVNSITEQNEELIPKVTIGTQIWSSKNLNVSTFKNGDAIPEAKTAEAWVIAGKEGKPAWCYYDNDPKNSDKYGKLYNWHAVNDLRGLAPNGWHIPSDVEWIKLTDYLGGEDAAGNKMSSKEGWNDWNGSDESGFSGLPGGYRDYFGAFYDIGDGGLWWSSKQTSISNAWSRNLSSNVGSVYGGNGSKDDGYSVRYLRDDAKTSVTIGQQEWMFNNLNIATFRNGDTILEIKTEDAWEKAGENGKPAWCYYDNDPKNGEKYGKLYNWHAVNDPRGLAPSGWHIPSDAEWTILIDYLGGKKMAGNKMKSKEGWEEVMGEDGNGNDESGFSALPGGCRVYNVIYIGLLGCWWSSTQQSTKSAWTRELNYENSNVGRRDYFKRDGFSVRCIMD